MIARVSRPSSCPALAVVVWCSLWIHTRATAAAVRLRPDLDVRSGRSRPGTIGHKQPVAHLDDSSPTLCISGLDPNVLVDGVAASNWIDVSLLAHRAARFQSHRGGRWKVAHVGAFCANALCPAATIHNAVRDGCARFGKVGRGQIQRTTGHPSVCLMCATALTMLLCSI